jgi:hypothetical protein
MSPSNDRLTVDHAQQAAVTKAKLYEAAFDLLKDILTHDTQDRVTGEILAYERRLVAELSDRNMPAPDELELI